MFLPKEHLDNLSENNLGDVMEAAGIGAPDMDKMIMMGKTNRSSNYDLKLNFTDKEGNKVSFNDLE